jgi:hypothetical protein
MDLNALSNIGITAADQYMINDRMDSRNEPGRRFEYMLHQ